MEVETIKQMRVDINSALKDVAKQYNANITFDWIEETANARYDSNNITLQLKVGIKDEASQVRTPEMAAFESCATIYGITKQLGDKVIENGSTRYQQKQYAKTCVYQSKCKVFTITGIKTGWSKERANISSAHPVLATSNGKTYNLTINSINSMECIK